MQARLDPSSLRSTTGQTKIDAANRSHTVSNNAMIPLVRFRD